MILPPNSPLQIASTEIKKPELPENFTRTSSGILIPNLPEPTKLLTEVDETEIQKVLAEGKPESLSEIDFEKRHFVSFGVEQHYDFIFSFISTISKISGVNLKNLNLENIKSLLSLDYKKDPLSQLSCNMESEKEPKKLFSAIQLFFITYKEQLKLYPNKKSQLIQFIFLLQKILSLENEQIKIPISFLREFIVEQFAAENPDSASYFYLKSLISKNIERFSAAELHYILFFLQRNADLNTDITYLILGLSEGQTLGVAKLKEKLNLENEQRLLELNKLKKEELLAGGKPLARLVGNIFTLPSEERFDFAGLNIGYEIEFLKDGENGDPTSVQEESMEFLDFFDLEETHGDGDVTEIKTVEGGLPIDYERMLQLVRIVNILNSDPNTFYLASTHINLDNQRQITVLEQSPYVTKTVYPNRLEIAAFAPPTKNTDTIFSSEGQILVQQSLFLAGFQDIDTREMLKYVVAKLENMSSEELLSVDVRKLELEFFINKTLDSQYSGSQELLAICLNLYNKNKLPTTSVRDIFYSYLTQKKDFILSLEQAGPIIASHELDIRTIGQILLKVRPVKLGELLSFVTSGKFPSAFSCFEELVNCVEKISLVGYREIVLPHPELTANMKCILAGRVEKLSLQEFIALLETLQGQMGQAHIKKYLTQRLQFYQTLPLDIFLMVLEKLDQSENAKLAAEFLANHVEEISLEDFNKLIRSKVFINGTEQFRNILLSKLCKISQEEYLNLLESYTNDLFTFRNSEKLILQERMSEISFEEFMKILASEECKNPDSHTDTYLDLVIKRLVHISPDQYLSLFMEKNYHFALGYSHRIYLARKIKIMSLDEFNRFSQTDIYKDENHDLSEIYNTKVSWFP